MKRYIILFNNGRVVQQIGLNSTYLHLFNMGMIKIIIDVREGKMLASEKCEWNDIPEYHDSSLVEYDNKTFL
jgi:hypothetical protein